MKHIEDQTQAMVMQWARLAAFNGGKVSDYLHHSPNGGKRNLREAVRLKAQGVLAGMPDLFLFVARHGYFGLFIEMKSPTGTTSTNQKEVMRRLSEQGYKCVVCKSFESAQKEIKEYLGI
jgi:hypothetical protein